MWTTASTVDEALAQLSMTDKAPAAASRGSRVPLAGMSLPVVSAKTVQIDDGGVVKTVHLAAPNVAGLLEAAGVPLAAERQGGAGRVVAGGGRMQIQVTRIRIEKVTQRVPLQPASKRIEDATMNMSRQIVEDPGTPGTQDVTFAIATRERRRNRPAASSQCRLDAGPRRGAAGRRQARHRGAAGQQRSHLGCACAMRSRR